MGYRLHEIQYLQRSQRPPVLDAASIQPLNPLRDGKGSNGTVVTYPAITASSPVQHLLRSRQAPKPLPAREAAHRPEPDAVLLRHRLPVGVLHPVHVRVVVHKVGRGARLRLSTLIRARQAGS